jgi:hypothetical protein
MEIYSMAAQYPVKRVRRSRQQWQQIIEQFESTDVSVSAFCRQHSLSYPSFLKWRTLLQDEVNQTAMGFVEIVPELNADTPTGSSGWAVELSLGNNIVLRINQPA